MESTSDQQPQILAAGIAHTPDIAPAPRHPPLTQRNTVRDTWGWLWKDSLGRVTPFLFAAAVYYRVTKNVERERHRYTPAVFWRDVCIGTAVGAPLAAVSAVFRVSVAPGYRLPTRPDHVVQTTYYFALNAPAEELFWRGTIQTLAIKGLYRVLRSHTLATGVGWATTTAAFGAYHRLGKWSWKSIAGVTVAGGLFGLMQAFKPKRTTILAPIIAHGFATAGFLNWGDVAAHWWRVNKMRRG